MSKRKKVDGLEGDDLIYSHEAEIATPDPFKSVDPEVTELVVENCGSLNVRSRPSIDSKVVLVISKGSRVILVGYEADWAQIKTTATPSTKGYVLKYFLRAV